MIKVSFDASFEDLVDVSKRSAGRNVLSYVIMFSVVLAIGLAAAGLLYVVFGDWIIAAIVLTVSLMVGGFSVASAQEQNIRSFLKKRIKAEIPIYTEFEIDEKGVTSRALGQAVFQDWIVIESIEETDDAIYFRNMFGLFCAVRKRGFENDEEKTEFLNQARAYWSARTLPDPPTFDDAERPN
jgi:hypothetical protein